MGTRLNRARCNRQDTAGGDTGWTHMMADGVWVDRIWRIDRKTISSNVEWLLFIEILFAIDALLLLLTRICRLFHWSGRRVNNSDYFIFIRIRGLRYGIIILFTNSRIFLQCNIRNDDRQLKSSHRSPHVGASKPDSGVRGCVGEQAPAFGFTCI